MKDLQQTQNYQEQTTETPSEMSPEEYDEMLDQIPMLKQMQKERQDELDMLGENTTEIELKNRLETEIAELGEEIAGRKELSEETSSLEDAPVTIESVIQTLDEKGVEDPEAKALMLKLIDQYQAEESADPKSGEASTRAKIECEIKIAQIYLATKRYRDEGINSLWDALEMAIQRDTYQDLQQKIRSLIDENS